MTRANTPQPGPPAAAHGDEIADIIAAIAAAETAIDAAKKALAALSARDGAHHGAPPINADEPAWATLDQAAGLRQCSAETMQRHVIANGLGVKIGGRWRVDLNRVRRWQKGDTTFARLNPLPDE